MSAIPKHRMTIEEYIEFDKNNEGRWEYFDGEVFDMAGGTLNHNQIASNISRVLGNKLGDKGCRALSGDMRLKVPKALPYRYPDAVVVCGEPIIEKIQGQEMLVNPRLIIEVLSPSTAQYDYSGKFIAYQSIESFREYLLVVQDSPHVIQYARRPDGLWLRRDIEGIENMVAFASVDCELTCSEIYSLVKFPPVGSVIRPV
ncbi:MAG: Uma2 family endonuclease [Chloracidobacterium sp.]|nr:Uma2 family endonuclease [Chloracidobacterium sp.]